MEYIYAPTVFYLLISATLLLPYVIYRYFHSKCSFVLPKCMPPYLRKSRCTSLIISPSCFHNSLCKLASTVSLSSLSLSLWNYLLLSVSPPFYGLTTFQRGVSRHLSMQNLSVMRYARSTIMTFLRSNNYIFFSILFHAIVL